MAAPALTALPHTVVPLVNANEPSVAERAFSCLHETLMRSAVSNEARLQHLKGSLRSWMIAAKNPGFASQTTRNILDNEDEALLKQLQTIVAQALEQNWDIARLCRTLKVTALAEGTIHL